MNNTELNVSKTPSNYKRSATWRVIYKDGREGSPHMKASHAIEELMQIEEVNDEVMEQLTYNFTFDMNRELAERWVMNHCADIARNLGYNLVKSVG